MTLKGAERGGWGRQVRARMLEDGQGRLRSPLRMLLDPAWGVESRPAFQEGNF